MSNRSRWVNDKQDDFMKNLVPDSVDCQPKRVILLLDIDCFEVQVWLQKMRYEDLNEDLDEPMVVINRDKKILSVNYTAKSMGVKRGQGLEYARALCLKAGSRLEELDVGDRYRKTDTFTPFVESNRILNAIFSWTQMGEARTPIKIEQTSRDDFYIDVTDLINSFKNNSIYIPSKEEIIGLIRPKDHPCSAYDGQPTTCMEGPTGKIVNRQFRRTVQQMYLRNINTDDLSLVHGALIADSIIQHINMATEYKVSAGVGHSKLVAKLACGLNKPSGISIIPDVALPRLSKTIRFQDLPRFGGKTGDALQNWLSSNWEKNAIYIDNIRRAILDGINFGAVFQELGFSNYRKMALDLHNKCEFKDERQVTSKVYPDTISTLVSFKGSDLKSAFDEGVWNISQDMQRRIEHYRRYIRRTATELIVKFDTHSGDRTRASPMALPQETNQHVSHESIRDFILETILKNGLNWKNIWKIHLTARKITDEDQFGI